MKKRLILITFLAASFSCGAAYHKGELLSLKDGGMVCQSLDSAIGTRNVVITNQQGGKVDMLDVMSGKGCLNYSIRPLKFVKYDDYLIPGYPEKGKLFASVIEPRSGKVWHIFTEFLEQPK